MGTKAYILNIKKVYDTLKENMNKTNSMPEAFGLSKEFADGIKQHKIEAICMAADTKAEAVADMILFSMGHSATDEEFMYVLYTCLMVFGAGCAMDNPLTMIARLLGNDHDE